MQNPEEVLGRVREAAAKKVFEDDVKTRQAHLRSINHPQYPVTPFMPIPDSTAARDGSPPVTKKRATGFAAMLATPKAVVKEKYQKSGTSATAFARTAGTIWVRPTLAVQSTAMENRCNLKIRLEFACSGGSQKSRLCALP